MTVREFIKKWSIRESEMRIYDGELEDEIWRLDEMTRYYDCEVVKCYDHNGDAVLEVRSIRG